MTGQRELVAWMIAPFAATSRARLKEIPSFDARGMRRIDARSDSWPGHPAFHLEMWLARNGRAFARFSSRGASVEPCSYEVLSSGITEDALDRVGEDREGLVPSVLRRAYGSWCSEWIDFPDG